MSRWRTRKWLLHGGKRLKWLFNAEFKRYADQAPPLPSPLEAVPGPGALVITDTESQLLVKTGELSANGGGISTTYGDPAAVLSGTIDPVDGLAHVARVTTSDSGYFIHQTNDGLTNALFVATSAQWRSGAGAFVSLGASVPATFCSVRCARHVLVLADGKLLWVDDIAPPSAAFAPAVFYGRADKAAKLAKAALLDLPASGYRAWRRDWTEVTDSGVAAWIEQEPNAEIHATLGTYPPASNIDLLYRCQGRTTQDCYLLRVLTSGIFVLYRKVGGVTTSITNHAALSATSLADMRIVCDGTRHRAWANGTLLWDVTDSQWQLGTNVYSYFDTTETHPYPALGIATARELYPWNSGASGSHPDEIFVRLTSVALPASDTGLCDLYRSDASNRLVIRALAAGTVDVYRYSSSLGDASLLSVAHTDGNDVTIRVRDDGGAKKLMLWSGTTSAAETDITSTINALTGRAWQVPVIAGGGFAELQLWPVDLRRKLPRVCWAA